MILRDHNLLTIETHREKMLGFIPNEELRTKLRNLWANMINSNKLQNDDGHTASEILYRVLKQHYDQYKEQKKIRDQDLSI